MDPRIIMGCFFWKSKRRDARCVIRRVTRSRIPDPAAPAPEPLAFYFGFVPPDSQSPLLFDVTH